MMLGEVSPGGVGVGLNGLLIMAILSVFIAGLMVGRTPEYLGKKIQAAEMKMVALYVLAMPAGRARLHRGVDVRRLRDEHDDLEPRAARASPRSSTRSPRPATTTARRSPGITAATHWMDTTLGLAMLVGRFFLIIPVLAIAGSLARKQVHARDRRARSRPTPRCSSAW